MSQGVDCLIRLPKTAWPPTLNKYTNYLEVTEQLFISESTLRRMVKRINLSLEQYHLRIRGLIRLTGNTQLIEKLTIQLLLEKYVCLEEAFNEEICQKSRQLYLKYITNNQVKSIILCKILYNVLPVSH